MTPAQPVSNQRRTRPRSRRKPEPAGTSAVWQLPLPRPFDAPLPRLTAPVVYTIGHSNLPADDFLALLRQHNVNILLDVRSSPYSRYVPHFNRELLQALVADTAQAIYQWAGDTLGGRPGDPTCYFDGIAQPGNVDYAQLRQRAFYQEGIGALLTLATTHRVSLMCSEEDPRRCHRHTLIARSLADLGVSVLHIRRTGETENAGDIVGEAPGTVSPQLRLEGFAA